jgi:regulatory protein
MEYKVTSLKQQNRNPNRVNVYLDGEYAFGLARIVAAWLQIDQLINDEKIDQLKNQDEVEVGVQKSLLLLGYRARSENEIRKKLTEIGLSQLSLDKVIDRLRGAGYVQDEQFAREWVENRSEFRPRSKRLLAIELRQKGVSEEIIQDTLSNVDDEETLAYQAAIKRLRRLEDLDWDEFRKKLTDYLGRRGFNYSTISLVVHRVWSENVINERTT